MSYHELIALLQRDGYLQTPRIIQAFKKIDRHLFLPPEESGLADLNVALPIGHDQTISQPLTVAFMLEKLQPQPGETIMDIGAGSGWTSALLAELVGAGGKVYAVERIPELCAFGKANVAKFNFIEKGRVESFCQDASGGLPEKAPFDGILVSAELSVIPRAWAEQLNEGGRILAPVRQSLQLFQKEHGQLQKKGEWPGFIFVPFISEHNSR